MRVLTVFFAVVVVAGSALAQTNGSSPCKAQLDIFLVVDNSGSLNDDEWYNDVRPFLGQLSQIFELGPDKVQLGATFFNATEALRRPITDSPTTWFGWLNNYPCAGNTGGLCSYGVGMTNAEVGFDAAVQYLINGTNGNNLIRPNAEKVIFLVTDGVMSNIALASAAANRAKAPPNNIAVFCVGVDGANVGQMNDMASGTNGLLNGNKTVFKRFLFTDLPQLIPEISTAVSGLFNCAGNEVTTAATTGTTGTTATTATTATTGSATGTTLTGTTGSATGTTLTGTTGTTTGPPPPATGAPGCSNLIASCAAVCGTGQILSCSCQEGAPEVTCAAGSPAVSMAAAGVNPVSIGVLTAFSFACLTFTR